VEAARVAAGAAIEPGNAGAAVAVTSVSQWPVRLWRWPAFRNDRRHQGQRPVITPF